MRPQRRKKFLLAGIIFISGITALSAQESNKLPPPDSALEELPGFRERALVMRIVSQIVEQNQEIVWNSETRKVTIPGQPVGLRLEGSNVVVAVQFTAFVRPAGRCVLVAHGQIWTASPNEGISYYTSIQTIPLEFNETVYFFPLGSVRGRKEGDARIEIQLTIEPHLGSQDRNSSSH